MASDIEDIQALARYPVIKTPAMKELDVSFSNFLVLGGAIVMFLIAASTSRIYATDGRVFIVLIAMTLYVIGNLMMIRIMRENWARPCDLGRHNRAADPHQCRGLRLLRGAARAATGCWDGTRRCQHDVDHASGGSGLTLVTSFATSAAP